MGVAVEPLNRSRHNGNTGTRGAFRLLEDSYIDYPEKHPSDTKALIKNIQTIKNPVCLYINTSVLNSGV